MSHRTTITLSEEQYERLRDESARRGVGLAELVRLAVEQVYGTTPPRDLMKAINEGFGAWKDRDFDGESYVESLRCGAGRRVAD